MPSKRALGKEIGWAANWGGLPLYCVVLLEGLPLDRRLSAISSQTNRDVQQQLVERVTTVGATQSLIPALIWATIYGISLLLLLQRGSGRDLRQMFRGQWPLLALVVLSLASILWSPSTGKIFASTFHAAGMTLVAMAAAIRCHANAPSFFKALSVAFAVNLMAHLVCVVVTPDVGIAFDGRWMGMSTHSNTLGGYAWLGIWTSLSATILCGGKQRRIAFCCLVIALLLLAGSDSTTSIMAATLALTLMLFLRLSTHWSRDLRQLSNVVMASSLVAITAFIVASRQILNLLTADLGKSATFTGRDVIWDEALRLFVIHPWLGWGFDDNARVILETGFLHTGYHNGYLDLGVRGGAIALTLMGAALLMMGAAMLRVERAWRMVVVPMAAAFAIYNLMEVSLFAPRSSIWVVMSTLMFSTTLFAPKRNSTGSVRS